jgi:hypothetical protein
MKKLLASITLILVVSSCTNLQTIGGGAVGLSRTDELLMVGYTMEQIEEARANGQFEQLVKQVRASGAIQRADSQRVLQIQRESMQRKAKQEEERRRQIAQAQQAQYENYINSKKSICMSYGFTEDNAIATCVQREITNERNLLAAQQAQANAQAQADYQRRMNALSNYGRCLGTQGETFSSCANAWQGYTPPTKTVTKCQYDVFGNVITSTCKTQ